MTDAEIRSAFPAGNCRPAIRTSAWKSYEAYAAYAAARDVAVAAQSRADAVWGRRHWRGEPAGDALVEQVVCTLFRVSGGMWLEAARLWADGERKGVR